MAGALAGALPLASALRAFFCCLLSGSKLGALESGQQKLCGSNALRFCFAGAGGGHELAASSPGIF